MARARNIKPGFFKNEDLAECTPWARLLFAGLWILADREGRLEDRPKRIKGELFPFDSVEVEPLLQELQRFKFIKRYETDGMKAIQVANFGVHQTPHYSEKPSAIKPPELQESHPEEAGKTPGGLQEDPKKMGPMKGGAQPPDSLILRFSDSPNPEELPPDADASGSSAGPTSPRTRVPDCPYDAVVQAYHQALPMLPRVRLMDEKRRTAMRKRWAWVLSSTKSDGSRRATTPDEALDWLRDYFGRAALNAWLTGQQPSRTHPEWKADLDFLLTDKGLKAVIERTEVPA